MALCLFDLDGVLANFHTKLIRVYKERTGIELRYEQFTGPNMSQCFGEGVALQLIKIFNEPGFFSDLELLPNAQLVVEDILNNGHIIEICTAPPTNASNRLLKANSTIQPSAASEKTQWVLTNFPRLRHNITITQNKHLLRADMLVDDTFANIERWCQSNPNGVGYLIERPWNKTQGLLPSNAVRGDLISVPSFLASKWDSKSNSWMK